MRTCIRYIVLLALVVYAVSWSQNGIAEEPTLKATMVSLDHQMFPFIYLSVAVSRNGEAISTLTKANFQVTENGVLQTDCFDVTPPEVGGGVRLADIVFVLDVTGSMREEIGDVKDNMLAFMEALASSDIDYRIGFIVFGDVVYVYNDGNLYSNYSEIIDTINNVTLGEHGIGGGGDDPENQFEALAQAASMNYRPGTQRIAILLTDAPAHEADSVTSWTREAIKQHLVSADMIVFPVFDTSQSLARDQYIPIAEATNPKGTYFNVYDNFNAIITEIAVTIGSVYVVQYKSSNPVFDGTERHVVLTVTYQGEQATCEGTYIPGSAPRIRRTANTLALHTQPWAAGTEFTIEAEITDDVEPYVQSATLYYRTTGETTYKSIPMTHSSDIWTATIPGSAVKTPGLDYYISATDGQSTATSPRVDPRTHPHQLAILPNVAPQITHTPVTTAPANTSITITAQVVDTTNAVATVELWYRKVGQLVFQTSPMSNVGGDTYSSTIPSSYVTEAGVEYCIFARDDLGVGSWHGTPDDPHLITVGGNQPPDTKIEIANIDPVKGTATFTWSGTDDTTPTKDLVYSYRLAKDSVYNDWSPWSSATTVTYTDLEPGNYRFQVRAKDADGAIDPSPASREFVVEELENYAPIARASDIGNQPKDMYPDTVYTVTAEYFDPDGREDLKYCYLRPDHPKKPLTMMWYQEDGHAAPWAGEEGENYLARVEATATEIVDPETGYEGYEIAWTFEINDSWPEAENAIDFGVCATDDSDTSSAWEYDETNASFRRNRPPNPPEALAQCLPDGSEIPVGERVGTETVVFKGVVSDPDGDRVKLQVELRRLDELGGGFDETQGGLKESDFVTSGSEALCTARGLMPGEYHWRARTLDEHSLTSEWVDFGANELSEADFRVIDYLGFKMGVDNWQFNNSRQNMWPQSWWSQFDYSPPEYPLLWQFWPINARSQDFPDWPLFVEAFGENQCYLNPPPGLIVYRPSAVLKWARIKGNWGGSCFGFAITAFLFFDGYLSLSAAFPGSINLHSVSISDKSRKLINKYFIYQFGENHLQYINQNANSSPSETLLELREMMRSEKRDDRILVFFNQSGSGGHAVNPYRIEPDAADPNITYIYVYDNNHPDSEERIIIDTRKDTWFYSPLGWGGSKGLFLMEPVSSYTTRPIMASAVTNAHTTTMKFGPNLDFLELYVGTRNDVIIKTPTGESMGYQNGRVFSNVHGAMPIIPITGTESPPIGYLVPQGEYTIDLITSDDYVEYITVFADMGVFDVTRKNVGAGEHDSFLYANGWLEVHNIDVLPKTYDITGLSYGDKNSENICHITNFVISGDSSAMYKQGNNGKVIILKNNSNTSSHYNLQLIHADAQEIVVVEFGDIAIGAFTSHTISPAWEELRSQPLVIEIDSDLDGITDEEVTLTPIGTQGDGYIYPGPNPVPTEGCIFWFDLPEETREAKLMIFDVLGRLVNEIQLDVSASRFPTVGLWNPVDQDGVPLANGPYIYVLVADGKVIGQGKMVIQR